MKIGKCKVVHIEWWDACSLAGWWKPDDDDGPMLIQSVGLLAHETKTGIVISTGTGPHGKFVDKFTIPRCAVKRIRYL